jgi:hypothetical protein
VGNLLARARNRTDLSRRLQEFKGVGPVTARIFLRDIKPLLFNVRSGQGARLGLRQGPQVAPPRETP